MTKARRELVNTLKDRNTGQVYRALGEYLYALPGSADLQLLTACDWYADFLRCIADAVQAEYGTPAPQRAETPVRHETENTSEKKENPS